MNNLLLIILFLPLAGMALSLLPSREATGKTAFVFSLISLLLSVCL